MKILIADDERELLGALSALFERRHFACDLAENGDDALRLLQDNHYDAAVLDIMMPGKSGTEVLSAMRAEGDGTPVLLLSAKGDIDDRVHGLELGADDYLVKPFAPRELIARITALTRRAPGCVMKPVSFADLTLDEKTGSLLCGGVSIALGNKEYQLMEMLMRSGGMLCTIDAINERLWDGEADVSLIWVNIASLRKKMAQLDTCASIVTRRGVGYSLEEKN